MKVARAFYLSYSRHTSISSIAMPVVKQEDITRTDEMPTSKGGSAVGVPNRKWFVAIVKNNTELVCQEKLEKKGFEAYVPTQDIVALDSKGRRKVVPKILIPAKMLLHVTESERKEIVEYPYIIRYMTDIGKRTDKFGHHPVATIPNDQISKMKFVLGHADAPVEFEQTFNYGDKVRVIRGGLAGIEGNVIECGDDTFFTIQISFLGIAKVKIAKEDLEHNAKKM